MQGMETPYSRTIIGQLPWYSVLVVGGMMLAVWLAGREEKRLGLPVDTAVDLALAAVPAGIIGARLYYVLMSWEQFAKRPVSVLYVWQGGLGIYGGVIGGVLAVYIYAQRKKLSFALLADMLAPGLLLAQAVGRWGNYFNMEAYGVQITDPRLQFFPLAVWIPADEAWHAATFFYESVWNLCGFAALWMMRAGKQKKGSIFAWYLLIYGAGRFVIEQLRTDSLYIGQLRASQWLSLVLCVGAAATLIIQAKEAQKAERNLAFVCAAFLFARWMAFDGHGLYALLLVGAGVTGIWNVRENPRGLLWMITAVMLDGLGLAAAAASWPFETAAAGVHAALCCASLPMGIRALCSRK